MVAREGAARSVPLNRPGGRVEAIREEGCIDDRELQALAGVNRGQLHCSGVAFEAPAALRRWAGGIVGELFAQPGRQGIQAEPLAQGRLVQQLSEVLHVGHRALAPGLGEEALVQSSRLRGGGNRGDATQREELGPPPHRGGDRVRQRLPTGIEFEDALADEGCQCRRANPPGTIGLLHGLQEHQPPTGRGSGEDTLVAREDGWDPQAEQGVAHHPQLLAGGAEDGNISGVHRAAGEGGTTGQNRSDVGGAIPGDRGARFADPGKPIRIDPELGARGHPQPPRMRDRQIGQTAGGLAGVDAVHNHCGVA